ncbi:MAG: PrsW family intramembrane metalloprotease [Oscillospiraceae bacterium]|nr:PrsW family intramembrane metalloprotease [Oscillospiraceae bacterium]MBR2806974.1 PrsW family intramembrane metalloprotease [Oscillospiraceae bacterium]
MFFIPSYVIVIIYVLAAIIPAAILLRYIYKKDTVEKEPLPLLASLCFMGVLAAAASVVLEGIGEGILNAVMIPGTPSYYVVLAFLVVAAVEEGTKMIFLYWRSWKSPYFNFRFDGIVYAVFVSLGFAAIENVEYVLGYGLSVAVSRAVLSIPGHMGFAVVMGLFYGRAKWYDNYGYHAEKRSNLLAAYITSVALHGFYDACAMIGSGLSMILFIIFVIAMYIVIFKLIKKESATDAPIV